MSHRCLLELTAGDYVEVYVNQINGGDLNYFSTASLTTGELEMVKIDNFNSSVILEKRYCIMSRNTTQDLDDITTTLLLLNVATSDKWSMCSVSNNRVIINKEGYYNIYAYCYFGSYTREKRVHVYKNGVLAVSGEYNIESATADSGVISCTGILKLEA